MPTNFAPQGTGGSMTIIGPGGAAPDSAFYLLTVSTPLLPNGVTVTAYPFVNADIATNAAIAMSKIAQPSSVQNFQLTTTTGTTIASAPISAAGNYQVNAYARVATAGTTLTLGTSWTDSVGAQSFSWMNTTFQSVGSYVLPQVFFNAVAGATLVVTGKAFAANNVFVSSSIVGPL